MGDEIVNTLIEETKQNFATFFNQKIIELKLGPFF